MEFVEVMKHKGRLCNGIEQCSKCILSSDNNRKDVACSDFMVIYSEEAEKLIMKWAEEHPIKTNGSHFLEEFPNAYVSGRKYNSDKAMMVYVHLNQPGIKDDGIYFPAEWWDKEYEG